MLKLQKAKDKQRTRTAIEEIKLPSRIHKNERAKTMATYGLNRQKKLFEEFFVIGTDVEGVENIKNRNSCFVSPKKLFQYPNLKENKNW